MVPMVLSIKSAKADRMARDLAELTGETITEAVETALEARLTLERRRRGRSVADIVSRFRSLPVLDDRTPEAILGYDEGNGLPS